MRAVLLAILLVGCGTDPAPVPTGPHTQYVMRDLIVPPTNSAAREYGLDLNGDRAIDNQLGLVFATLKSLGLGVDATAREAVVRGGMTLLVDLQTPDFTASELAGVTTYLGTDPSPTPCLDPARLDTCGQHLLGTGHFTIVPGSASDLGMAPIAAGKLLADVGALPIEIALDPAAPLRLDLYGARIELTGISAQGFRGVIAGAIHDDDVQRVIVPQAAHEIQRIVAAECKQPLGAAPCGCIGSSRADLLQDYMDVNNDCEVTLAEVQHSGVVESLLAPDVRVQGEDGLSFGVGIVLVPATFE